MSMLTLAAFSWRSGDELTAIAHKHLDSKRHLMPMREVRREQMAAFCSSLSSCGCTSRHRQSAEDEGPRGEIRGSDLRFPLFPNELDHLGAAKLLLR